MKRDSDWFLLLESEMKKDYFQQLQRFVEEERERTTVFPKKEDMFRAFEYSSFADTKVVILGQDPYHGQGQAQGLSFSVPDNFPLPPSLRNIYKELQSDIGCDRGKNGNLEDWAKQGVLLLNTVLTVEEGKANSHKKRGWEQFTDHVLQVLQQKETPVVFILWGNSAKEKKKFITNKRHYVIESAHPSPLAVRYGFFGSKPFSKTNEALQGCGQEPILWCNHKKNQ